MTEYQTKFELPSERFGSDHVIPVTLEVGNLEKALGLDLETSSPELGIEYDPAEVVEAITASVQRDIETLGAEALLDVEVALPRALEAYDTYAEDTIVPPQNAVAEYFAALTEAILADDSIKAADVEQLFKKLSAKLEELDEALAA